jgi:hypothetical protein
MFDILVVYFLVAHLVADNVSIVVSQHGEFMQIKLQYVKTQ